MNYSEAISKRFFESFLPGSRMNYNPAQAHGEHDFNLHFNDGTTPGFRGIRGNRGGPYTGG